VREISLFSKALPSILLKICIRSIECSVGSALAHLFLSFFYSQKSGNLAPFQNGPAITDFLKRTSTPFIACIGSNVTVDTMADAGAPSGAMNDAPCDDVSRFSVGMGNFFTQYAKTTCRAMCV
jgi:hypothetical protein